MSFDNCDAVKEPSPSTKIVVLLVSPRKYPQPIQIGFDYEDFSRAVGGIIEVTFPFEDPVAVVVNHIGKAIGCEPNRALYDKNGKMYDILSGNFIVVGLGESDFTSLSPELMKKYEKRFHNPELFINAGGLMLAVPMSDKDVKKQELKAMNVSAPKSSPFEITPKN